ncbi:MAG: type III-B CRISPR module RAMP protein Cmr6 [Syntrophus sp. (in: bacteria)]|nr:type III-B CRISPR module RAMP protein Cmr6 [Syntrophus sp. (in: bacteria)]
MQEYSDKGGQMFIPLPESVEVVLNSDNKNSNYALLFNKWLKIEGTFESPKELKDGKIKEFIRLKDEYGKRESQLKTSATAQKARTNNILCQLQQNSLSVAIVTCKVSDALVCGIGDEHPLENSLRLDHCTGLPYIPSSSIKGVANFAAESDESTDEITREKVFGTQDQIGKVQFWDGFPVEVPALKIDIMNNHFPDYYSGKSSAPSDDMNPNPVPFIVVDSDSEFYFPIVAPDQGMLQQATQFLEKALEEWGVGAKTSVGYGMFYDFEEKAIIPPPSKPKALSPRDKAFENLKKTVNPENFGKLLLELKEKDEEWLKNSGLFAIPNLNAGFAEKVIENKTVPSNIRKALAQQFVDEKINLKEAIRRAEKKNDRKELNRYEKLKGIVDGID